MRTKNKWLVGWSVCKPGTEFHSNRMTFLTSVTEPPWFEVIIIRKEIYEVFKKNGKCYCYLNQVYPACKHLWVSCHRLLFEIQERNCLVSYFLFLLLGCSNLARQSWLTPKKVNFSEWVELSDPQLAVRFSCKCLHILQGHSTLTSQKALNVSSAPETVVKTLS